MRNLSNPLLLIGGKPRIVPYLVLSVVAIGIGALDQFYGEADPEWVQGLVRVGIWIAPILGLTAATHVPSAPDTRAVAVDPPAEVRVLDAGGPGDHRDDDGDGIADAAGPARAQ